METLLIVGGAGVIGTCIRNEMGDGRRVMTAGRNSGDLRVDLSESASIKAMFERSGPVDILIAAAGEATYGALENMDEALFRKGVENKLLGQANLVRFGLPFVTDGGAIVLTSGCTNVQPVRNGAVAGLINGGLEGFVAAAAADMPRGIRINCVSPGVVRENSALHAHKFPGFTPVEGTEVARAYHRCAASGISGQTIRVH
jgi:NAD(P)-dependent dehydrogenase (short-subunit alcohol dehydrogenase family)